MMSLILMSLHFLTTTTSASSQSMTEVYKTEPKKTQVYIHEGVIEGGDEKIEASFISNIRRSKNSDFERIVLDFDSKKIPNFHVSVEPKLKRVLITVFGNTKPTFNAPDVIKGFKKSSVVEKIELFPKIDEKIWTFSLKMNRMTPVEVFTLSSPERVVIDLKTIRLADVIKENLSDENN